VKTVEILWIQAGIHTITPVLRGTQGAWIPETTDSYYKMGE